MTTTTVLASAKVLLTHSGVVVGWGPSAVGSIGLAVDLSFDSDGPGVPDGTAAGLVALPAGDSFQFIFLQTCGSKMFRSWWWIGTSQFLGTINFFTIGAAFVGDGAVFLASPAITFASTWLFSWAAKQKLCKHLHNLTLQTVVYVDGWLCSCHRRLVISESISISCSHMYGCFGITFPNSMFSGNNSQSWAGRRFRLGGKEDAKASADSFVSFQLQTLATSVWQMLGLIEHLEARYHWN